MLPIYYGTSFLTFCQISGLKEAFEKIIKYQTAPKFEFRSIHMHLIGQKIFTILRMLIFPATEICAELCCQSTWGHFPQLSAKLELWMKHLSVFDMKQQNFLKLILLRVSLCSVQVSFHEYPVSLSICCYMLHICPHASVTQKW